MHRTKKTSAKGKRKLDPSTEGNLSRKRQQVTSEATSAKNYSDKHSQMSVPRSVATSVYNPECLSSTSALEDLSSGGNLNSTNFIQPSVHSALSSPLHSEATYRVDMLDTPTPGQKVNQGYFPGAHNFTIERSNMYDIKQDIKVLQNEGSETLAWLEKHIMEGAEFNSYERDPPPRCHPGTRTSIIDRISGWVDNPQRKKRSLWLRGPAGVGKSAIVQTLSERLSESQQLGASLFFSRPNGRSNPQQVFPTLAYQLAIEDPAYKAYLTDVMSKDPRSLDKAMNEQFRILIIEPFVRKKIRSGRADLLLAIDGLDECAGYLAEDCVERATARRGRTSEQVHCEIVRLISSFVHAHPSAPLLWVIASRPEVHLKAAFASESVVPTFWEEDIPVDSDEACRDVEKFLHASFTRIREDYPYHFHESLWPTNEQFLLIAKAASGLFVFAEVVIRFIEDPRVGHPVAQLEYVLLAISKLRLSQGQTNPLAVLDAIYTVILARIPETILENTKKQLQLLMFLNRSCYTVAKFPFHYMYQYVGISRDDAIVALRHLHSVIHFPKVKDTDRSRPRFYHASFRDYLKDPARSSEYSISELKELDFTHLWSTVIIDFFGSAPAKAVLPPGLELSKGDSYDLLTDLLRNGRLSSSGISIKWKEYRCSISDAQLQSILENLSFKQMARSSWNKFFWNLRLDLLRNFHVDELKRNKILSVSSIRTLNIRSIEGMFSIFQTKNIGNCLVIDLEDPSWLEELYTKRDQLVPATDRFSLAQICARFAKLLSDAPETPIYVWGFKDGERCAVIRMSDLPDFWLAQDTLDLQRVFIVGF